MSDFNLNKLDSLKLSDEEKGAIVAVNLRNNNVSLFRFVSLCFLYDVWWCIDSIQF